MLRVTIELIPHGDENSPDREEIGKLEIYNDGTGTKVRYLDSANPI